MSNSSLRDSPEKSPEPLLCCVTFGIVLTLWDYVKDVFKDFRDVFHRCGHLKKSEEVIDENLDKSISVIVSNSPGIN